MTNNTRHARTPGASAALLALCDLCDAFAENAATMTRAECADLVGRIDRAAAKVEPGQRDAALSACRAAIDAESIGDCIAIDALTRSPFLSVQ